MSGHNPFQATSDEETFTIDEDVAGDAAAIEEGDYILKCVGVEKDTSKSGNPMFVWTFQIIQDVDGKPVPDAPEQKVYTAITDKAMWKLEETLEAMGLGTVENGRIKASFKPSDVKGICCVGSIVIGEYNNRPKVEIKSLQPHPSGAGHKHTSGPF